MRCNPCRLAIDGVTYHVAVDGIVRRLTHLLGSVPLPDPVPLATDAARAVRREAARRRRNRARRELDNVRRSLGLVRTPYGWE